MANGVTFIDPAQGALANSLAALGKAAVLRGKREQFREEELMRDPKQMQALAASFRAATRAGQGSTFLRSIGVREGFGEALQTFQPTSTERLETAKAGSGLEQEEVDLRGKEIITLEAEGEVRRATAGAATTRGIPDLLADRLVLETGGDIEKLQTLSNFGFGNLSALRDIDVLDAERAQATYNSDLFDIRTELGSARIQVNAKNVIAKHQAALGAAQTESLSRAMEVINGIDQSTKEGRQMAFMAASFITADTSRFAQYLAGQEEMDFRMRLAKATGAPTVEDKVSLTSAVAKEIQDAVDNLRELEEDEADQDVLDVAIARLDSWNFISRDLQREDQIFTMDVPGAQPGLSLFGGRKGIEEYLNRVEVSGEIGVWLNEIASDPVKWGLSEYLANPNSAESKASAIGQALAATEETRQQEFFMEGLEIAARPEEVEPEEDTERSNLPAVTANSIQTQKASIESLQMRVTALRSGTLRNMPPARLLPEVIQQAEEALAEAQRLLGILEFRFSALSNREPRPTARATPVTPSPAPVVPDTLSTTFQGAKSAVTGLSRSEATSALSEAGFSEEDIKRILGGG